jgi:glycosyltransferase involved in cell wall biosynthesis
MFSALKLDNYRKGGDLVTKALQGLPASLKSHTVLLTIGGGSQNIAQTVGMQTVNLGYVNDEHRKAMAYSASDLFLFPTRADIFGLVSIESQACGTPVVSFRVGGVPETVIPGLTGYLAEPEDVDDFRNGIIQLLEDDERRNTYAAQCRLLAENYSFQQTVQRYTYLYKQLAANQAVQTRDDLVWCPSDLN